MNYDLIVIGGGPAGYIAAERAGEAKLNTLLVEKRALGGVCLNEGCVPSKTFLNSAKVLDYSKHASDYGVVIPVADTPYVDQQFVVERKNQVVKTLVTGVKGQLRKAKVTLAEGTAEIVSKTSEGFTVKVNDETHVATRLLIATGSSPVVPPIKGLSEGLESGFVMTNREILDLTTLPTSLVIIGGGVIGLEMASYFCSVGTKVTVVEMLAKIAGPTERDVSRILRKSLTEKGVEFQLKCKVTEFLQDGIVYEKEDGEIVTLKAEKALLSIGRRANTANLGLEKIGVNVERGAIVTDEKMMTNVKNVYAAGDVNGKIMLAHTAYRESEVAVNNMLGIKDKVNYNAIPSVIYTNPEVASVGYTKESAEEIGLPVKEVKLSLAYSGRYVAENTKLDGICKLVVNTKSNTVIGAHIIGSYAGEFIATISNLIDLEVDIENIKKLVFPHPTVSEIIRETVWAI